MLFVNCSILHDGIMKNNCFLRIKGNTITAIGEMKRLSLVQDEEPVVDLQDKGFLAPGFIDIHNHGALNYDFMDATQIAFDAINQYHYRHGVCAYLATTMTAPLTNIAHTLEVVANYVSKSPAKLIGAHLEGPFLSKYNCGAQPAEYLRAPDTESLELIHKYSKQIGLITVAPDILKAQDLIQFAKQNGITVSLGHDYATGAQVQQAIAAGASGVTHLHCCTSGVHRKHGAEKYIGLTETALANDNLVVEVIADGCHVPADLFHLIYHCKGFRKICLVSDAIRASGLSPGRYMLGDYKDGVEVKVTDRVALLKDESCYAGSITCIEKMVENLVSWGIPLAEAVYMASQCPATYLGLQGIGELKEGATAFINVLDANGKLLMVQAGEKNRLIKEHSQYENI